MPTTVYAPTLGKRDPRFITTFSRRGCGPAAQSSLKTAISSTGQTANSGYFYPFKLRQAKTVKGAGWLNATTVAGNVQIGVCDATGAPIAGAHTAVTAMATANVAQEVDFASPVTLQAGTYFLSFMSSDATATFARASTLAGVLRMFGVRSLASYTDATASAAAWVGMAAAYQPYAYLYPAQTTLTTLPPPNSDLEVVTIGTLNDHLGEYQALSNGGPASTAWPSNNLGIYVPIYVEAPFFANQFVWLNGASTTGTVDMGIYTEGGTKILSTGPTNQAGSGVPQAVTITGGLWIPPGTYYLGMDCSSTSTLINRVTTSGSLTGLCESLGVVQQAVGSATLPASITAASPGQEYIPVMALSTLTLAP